MSSSDSPARDWPPARVAFVGTGPGDPGLLTVRATERLAEADAVILDEFTREPFLSGMLRPGVPIIDGGRCDHGPELSHAARVKLVVRAARSTPRLDGGPGEALVVRLMDGDPGAFHGLVDEAVACQREGIPIEIVPGVSAVSAVPAYAGIPLTAGAESRRVLVACAEHPPSGWTGAEQSDTTIVLLGPASQISAGLAQIRDAGRPAQTPVALIEHGATVRQRTQVTTLAAAWQVLEAGSLGVPLLAVVGHTVGLREQLSWWETKALYGWRVLVPRTKDQAGPMVQALAAHGAIAEVVPTIGVEPPRTPQQMQRAIKGLVTGCYQWVGFTSVNAVRALRERFAELGLDARAFAGLKIAAVGGATSAALRDWGLEPDLTPAGEESAQGLLSAWPPFAPGLDPINGVLLPRADIATETLIAGLQQIGWEVDDVTAYRTVRAAPPPAPVREAIKRGDFDAVLFTSSSTVRNLIGIAGKPHPSTVVACIGPATARTAEEHGLTVSVLAARASSAALVEALAEHGRRAAAHAVQAGEEVRRPSARRAARRRKARS